MNDTRTPEQKLEAAEQAHHYSQSRQELELERKEIELEKLRSELGKRLIEDASSRPHLGKYVKFLRMKTGVLRFYLEGGSKYDSIPGAPIDELYEYVNDFYEKHTELKR